MSEKKDYSKYTFKPGDIVEIPIDSLQQVKSFIEQVIKENSKEFTKAKFEKVNKKTGKVAKGKVKKEEDYEMRFTPNGTISSNSEFLFTNLGKAALYMEDMLNKEIAKNIDAGKGSLIEDLEKEMQPIEQPVLEKVD